MLDCINARLYQSQYRVSKRLFFFSDVNDCEKYLAAYLSGEKSQWQSLGWDIDALPSDIYTPLHIVNHVFHQEGEHLFGYDFATLEWLLRQGGFTEIRRMSYGQSLDDDLAIDLPNHASYSLYVEAVRYE